MKTFRLVFDWPERSQEIPNGQKLLNFGGSRSTWSKQSNNSAVDSAQKETDAKLRSEGRNGTRSVKNCAETQIYAHTFLLQLPYSSLTSTTGAFCGGGLGPCPPLYPSPLQSFPISCPWASSKPPLLQTPCVLVAGEQTGGCNLNYSACSTQGDLVISRS